MSKGFTTSYRIALLAIAVLAMFAGLEARLVWLHVIDRDVLLRSVDEARRQLIVDNARRGDIVDAHGALLATSRSIIVLGVDPQYTRPEDRSKWPQLAALIGVPLAEVERTFLTKARPAVAKAEPHAAAPMVITLAAPVPAPAEAAPRIEAKAEAAPPHRGQRRRFSADGAENRRRSWSAGPILAVASESAGRPRRAMRGEEGPGSAGQGGR